MSISRPIGPAFVHPNRSFDEQYRAGMNGAIVLDRSHRALVRVEGKDRERFLQSMLSADVARLERGMGRPATFLTNKGKLVADLILFREAERFRMEMEAVSAEKLVASLGRYVISEDVTLELDAGETAFSVEGPEAASLLGSVLDTVSPLEGLTHLGFLEARTLGVTARVIAKLQEPSPRFDVALNRDRAAGVVDRLIAAGAVPAATAVAEARRIEGGHPRFGVDIDETCLPLEAGLEQAVSFDKGCYIGQEYVVRLAHRGHLNRKIGGLRLDGPGAVEIGSAVVSDAGNRLGEVTSSAHSPTLGRGLALAWLRREIFAPGTLVRVESSTEVREAVVTELPFIRPS
ncbi:MAG TPA: glycine cleavage T C-terminal barrel domain-containing protein [Vicinamibacteria bacterium]|nr:glycine cleavage T C-terminal barrel domain-containing protein [Vicinamibacteria bacterium]